MANDLEETAAEKSLIDIRLLNALDNEYLYRALKLDQYKLIGAIYTIRTHIEELKEYEKAE